MYMGQPSNIAMPTVKPLARDPHGTLRRLEKSLGAAPGELLEEMRALSDDEWDKHLPYAVAANYFNDVALQLEYGPHVDDCGYCQELLNAIQPPLEQVEQFAKSAAAASPLPKTLKSLHGVSPSGRMYMALAASVLLTFFAFVLGGALSKPDYSNRLALVNELRANPDVLSSLESSTDPQRRFRAAKIYFELQQPQLAYGQIAEGLALSGVSPDDAQAIAAAAHVPDNASGASLASAAQQLDQLQRQIASQDSNAYLEAARLQAKLGLHEEALQSIQKYLKAKDTDPSIVADYSQATFRHFEAAPDYRR